MEKEVLRERETETERDRDRDRERQRQRETEIERGSEIYPLQKKRKEYTKTYSSKYTKREAQEKEQR